MPMEDRVDALIRQNRKLLAWAATIRRQSQEQRVRCRLALTGALAAYDNAVRRQQASARKARRLV